MTNKNKVEKDIQLQEYFDECSSGRLREILEILVKSYSKTETCGIFLDKHYTFLSNKYFSSKN